MERDVHCQNHTVIVSELITVVDTPNRAASRRLHLTKRRFDVKESVALFVFIRIVVAPVSNFRGSLSTVRVPNTVIDSEPTGVFGAKAFEIKARDEMVTPRLVHLSFHCGWALRQKSHRATRGQMADFCRLRYAQRVVGVERCLLKRPIQRLPETKLAPGL
ncbi:hypothetical protein WI80_14625 [Burkholderia ubonensis]|nr:hypothetical protein [Burkholderia ubonensis]KVD08041.1 hypothetical protein WI80_14625 [Burkholderia ubonensis]KVU19296.1 hypothetical protein WK63_06640 [Burkholderia ubonensis]